jgi:transposase
MEAREQRGLEIAATKKLRRKGDLWLVPSQTGGSTYIVDPTEATPTCSCPDYETRLDKCKHVYAVEYTVRRETSTERGTVTESLKVTYRQEWAAYNGAQTHEKEHVARLLRDLCSAIDEPEQKRGRPRIPLADQVFVAVMKVYAGMSARRAMCDLRVLGERGLLSRVPHFNSVLNALENPALASVLTAMIEESAGPLSALESDFAVDSSGFSSSVYRRWFSEKYGKEKSRVRWIKAHLMVGTRTNIVTSVEVTDSRAHDSRFLEPLLNASMQRFNVERLSADKAYSSVRLLGRIHDAGAMPLIPFKYNATGRAESYPNKSAVDIWAKMYHFYMYRREEFLGFYHKRSNVETTFSMIKAKFGAFVRSKTPAAQMNEVLCKVLAHNLCCLVQSMYELGIEPEFWKAS